MKRSDLKSSDTPVAPTRVTDTESPARRPGVRGRQTMLRHLARALLLGGFALAAIGGFVDGADAASGVKAAIKKGVLTVAGTTGPDAITLRLDADDPSTLVVDIDGTPEFRFDRQRFDAIVANGGGGDDVLVLDRSSGSFSDTHHTTLDGGQGNDTLIGANGDETLLGGKGDDFVDGNQGADLIALGDGADTFQWDPGDGNDTVDGGTGSDRVALTGNGANEHYDLSAAPAGRVRLARNVGNVTLDLDDIETVDLRPAGGTDTVTVNDLTGTDLTRINTDLAANSGDDGQTDTVGLPPGVAIGQDGPAATVTGVGAQVRVLNGGVDDRIHVTGTTANDKVTVVGTSNADTVVATAAGGEVALHGATPGVHVRLTDVELADVDLGAGNDYFATGGNLAALITLDIDGEDGDDTLLGSNGVDVITGGKGDDFVDGNQGADLIALGDGADTFQWDPGDGNDTVDGGTGSDRVALTGNGANEHYDLSAAPAGRVRLARNVGNVTLDLDDIETVDLRPAGGTDTVTVNDLTGTDLTRINTDLGGIGTGADGVIDEVIVNGTAGDDAIGVVDQGLAAVVQGLAASVRITHADSALDRLTVNGLEGDDTIIATPRAQTMILLDLVP